MGLKLASLLSTLPLHPYYREVFGTKDGDYPNAERVLNHILCLPMHVKLSKENVKYAPSVSSIDKCHLNA